MRVRLDTSGLDRLRRNVRNLENEQQVPLTDLLTDSFIQRYTDYESLQALVDASGVPADNLDSEEFDKFVELHSRVGGWAALQQHALAELVKRAIG